MQNMTGEPRDFVSYTGIIALANIIYLWVSIVNSVISAGVLDKPGRHPVAACARRRHLTHKRRHCQIGLFDMLRYQQKALKA